MTMSPETDAKVRYGFWGFAVGAGVAMTIGFGWGGWTTSSTTQSRELIELRSGNG
jgi:hypothetical protein